MTPKRWMKKYCKKNYIICDGMSYETGTFDILYPLFIVSGLAVFLWLLRRWIYVKEKVVKK